MIRLDDSAAEAATRRLREPRAKSAVVAVTDEVPPVPPASKNPVALVMLWPLV
jgi:hypothetical protein